MRIGIMSTSLGGADLEKPFEQAAKAGFDGLEVVYAEPGEAKLLAKPRHADELKSLARQHKLAVSSLCMGCLCRQPSLLKKPAERAKAQDLIRKALGIAAEAEVPTILVPFFGGNSIELEDDLARAAEALAELAEEAENARVVLGIESSISFNRCRFLLDRVGNQDWVKMYYDTGNAVARKLDLPTGIRDLGPRTIAGIHFKDVRLAEGAPPEFNVAMGQGDVDFQAVVQALRAVHYDGWVVLETPPLEAPLENAKANLSRTREILAV